MKKTLVVLFLLFAELSYSQNYADSLNVFYKKISEEVKDSLKDIFSNKIIDLTESLVNQKLINQTLIDSIKGISILMSDNQKVVVVTYDVLYENNVLKYKGVVFNKINKTWYKNVLKDVGIKEKKLESFIGKPESWIGCRYYKMVTLKEKGRQKYILLSSNLSEKTISRKWIDVLLIDEKYDVYFGDNIFEAMPIKRYVLQYNSKLVTSLKYNEKKQLIIFDHLVPTRVDLKNQFQFYSPDLSFDAFEIRNDKLKFLKDIDARNSEK